MICGIQTTVLSFVSFLISLPLSILQHVISTFACKNKRRRDECLRRKPKAILPQPTVVLAQVFIGDEDPRTVGTSPSANFSSLQSWRGPLLGGTTPMAGRRTTTWYTQSDCMHLKWFGVVLRLQFISRWRAARPVCVVATRQCLGRTPAQWPHCRRGRETAQWPRPLRGCVPWPRARVKAALALLRQHSGRCRGCSPARPHAGEAPSTGPRTRCRTAAPPGPRLSAMRPRRG
jgi:hypothetical protein